MKHLNIEFTIIYLIFFFSPDKEFLHFLLLQENILLTITLIYVAFFTFKCTVFIIFLSALYKRTCEELYLVGYRKKGVYTIDIDRNGPQPPAHVYCDMGDESGRSIVTRVENNMPPEMVSTF